MEDMYLTRDEDNTLGLSIGDKPIKRKNMWTISNNTLFIKLDSSRYPEVQWSDEEPTKVKLVIDK